VHATLIMIGNDTQDMEYLTSLISKWMPHKAKVAVDSHPRLSGIMDTIHSTLSHGPETRLPSPFYDDRGREIIDKIGVEEWFSGYKESNEYRTIGIGSLAADIVARMVSSAEKSGKNGLLEVGGRHGETGQGMTNVKFGLSGCHDTTLAALLSSLGCFDGLIWPPYTSHIAFELFQKIELPEKSLDGDTLDKPMDAQKAHEQNRNPLRYFFGGSGRRSLSYLIYCIHMYQLTSGFGHVSCQSNIRNLAKVLG